MPVLAVLGTQWGDEGKGKVVDVLAERAQYVVRFQGGNNAGHTIVVGDETYKLHLLPSGCVSGKAGVIGNGCVVDPLVLMEEIVALQDRGVEFEIYISDRAHLIMPYHRILDGAEEAARGGGKVGTTGRGIGPCYADKAARTGIRAGDLLNRERFEERFRANVRSKQALLNALDIDERLDADEMLTRLEPALDTLAPFVTDTSALLHESLKADGHILLEGAQGALLDLDHGTYPFVTSSYVAGGGMCSGSGLAPRDIGDVVGVVKAYTTRVGSGPFPTELPTDAGIGKHLADVGHEFGTTTGRPRRCGWLDLVVVNHAVRLCGVTDLAVTKMDVLTGLETIKVCVAYESPDGKRTSYFPSDLDALAEMKPVYEEFAGWDELGDGTWHGMPQTARQFLQFLREKTGASIKMVGVGPKRSETIIK